MMTLEHEVEMRYTDDGVSLCPTLNQSKSKYFLKGCRIVGFSAQISEVTIATSILKWLSSVARIQVVNLVTVM